MAVYKRDMVDINLETGNIHRSFLKHSIGFKDAAADHFGIRVYRNGEPVDLTGVSVQGIFMPPQGDPIAITSGNIVSENEAEVVLPQACYNYDGQFTLAIKLVDSTNSVTGTIRIVDGMVDNTHASGTVAPTDAVPTYQEILSTYDDMLAATTAANTAATNCASIVAAAYSTSATYAVGDYCTKDGKLYRCTTAITTAESWTAGHWTETKVGPEVSDLKSALNVTDDAIEDIGIFVQSENIYSGVFTDGKQLNANGGLVDVTSYGTTDYIPVIGGKTVYLGYVNSEQYQSLGAGVAARYATYDKYFEPITVNTNAWVSSIPIDDNAAYLRFTASTQRLSGRYEVAYDALPATFSAYVKEYWKPKNEAQVVQNTSDIIANKTDADNKFEAIDEKMATEAGYDVAVGDMFETATTNDVDTGYIKSVRCDKHQRRDYLNRNVVAVNHDDLQPSDYLATRKIYNKFGFKANFNFILLPFTSKAQQESMIENVKALVADGHDLGLHAIMGASFWWMNKMFDMHPNFAVSFMPTLDEIKTVVADGKNVFGYTVGATTKFDKVGYANPPSSVTSVNVVDATNTDYIYLCANYCLYTMYTGTITGLDLDGNTQNWTGLKWLEYWYNELIDNTLGYSNNTTAHAQNYYADYAVPSGTTQSAAAYDAYYPDTTHLLNGKMVRFDDTTNPHYSDSDYQKVGYFTKGLFKGAFSCCNYEVVDRCIDIAKAFCKHYFGIDKFTNFGRHGVRYCAATWKDSNYVPYDNRGKTVLAGEVGKFYHSRSGKFMTEHDILLDKGIMMTNHYHPLEPIFESEIGLYYGQHGIRYPFFNHIYKDSGDIDYLAFFGTSSAGVSETMDYSTFISYMGGRDNWLKFAYENAKQTFTKPDGTGSMYMFDRLKNVINHIRATRGTGKIPVLSLDTIKLNAATMAAVELLCQYCYANGIEIVPMEKARVLAESFDREPLDNYFPNPGFNQSVLRFFGGESTSADAYMPDGWFASYQVGSVSYAVGTDTVNGNTERTFTVSTANNTSSLYLQSRAYGLPAGTYSFSIWAKQTSSTTSKGKFNIYKKKNSDYLERYYGDGSPKFSADADFSLTTEWAEYTATIVIPEQYQNMPDSSVASQYSKGYEDNVSNITFEIQIGTVTGGNSVSIALPKLERS